MESGMEGFLPSKAAPVYNYARACTYHVVESTRLYVYTYIYNV